MRYMLFLLVLMFANMAQALECQKLPDCGSLGYSQDKDPNCAENGYMYCPFDQNYKVCVQYNCKALGFTESDKSTWCADLIKCKGNQNMTLCQKSCFAADYNSLKDLAESGHCKVVTMRSDINIPANQNLTLAANTIIDGGNHTLSSSGNNKNFDVYNLNNNSGFKNIFIKHNQSQTQEGQHVFKGTNTANTLIFQDIQIELLSNDTTDHPTSVFYTGTYEISGKFTVDVKATRHYVLSQTALKFKNADINVNIKGASGDAFVGKTDFINSHGTITTEGVSIIHNQTLTLNNSQIHLNTPLNAIFYTNFGPITIHLQDNAELRLTCTKLAFNGENHNIKFESSSNAPAKLIVKGTQNLNLVNVTASNTTDTLVLNNTTYHPKQAGTTKFSEIESSGHWERE